MKDSVKDDGRTRRGRGGGRGGGPGGPRADRGRPGRGRRPRRAPRARRSRRPRGRGGRIDPGSPGQTGGARRGGRGRRGGGRRRRPDQGRAARARRDAGRPHPGHRVRLQEMFPGQTPEPAGRQEEDALPRLRLRARPSFLVSLPIALASGLLVSAASPPLGWWPLAFVGVAPFLWLLRSAGGARGAVLGFVFGVGSYGATFYWIGRFGEMAWVAITLLCAGSALVFGLFAPAVQRRGRPLLTAVGLASLWTVTDWVRTAWPLGGFSWGSLGVSQVDDRAVLRLATITGVWGVTFVVLAVNALLVEAAVGGGGGGRRVGPAAGGGGLDPGAAADPVLRPGRLRRRRRDVAGRRPAGGAGLIGRGGRGRRTVAHRPPRRSWRPIRRTSPCGGRARSTRGRPTTPRRSPTSRRRSPRWARRRSSAPCSTTPTGRNTRAWSC